jgi:MFS family permease
MDQKLRERLRRSFFGLDRSVVALGWVSLFMDVSSEKLYPLIPLFLTETLGASRTVLGLIEGVGESLASLWKIASGWISDRIGKRKLLILGGYGLSTASRPILALAGGWPAVLFFRIFDRTGKGVRTAPAMPLSPNRRRRNGSVFRSAFSGRWTPSAACWGR